MNFFENFQKAVDTNLNVEFDSDVNIDLDLNKNVEINSDSLVDVTGNFGSLEFDVTAAGENGFGEASASVFVGDDLVELSGAFVAGVGDFKAPDVMEPEFLLVADRSSDAIFRFNATTGDFVDSFVPTATLVDPVDVNIGSDGNLYIPNFNGISISIFDDETGEFLDLIDLKFADNQPDLEEPVDLEFREGLVYVLSNDSQLLGVLNEANGELIETFGGPDITGFPLAMEFGPDELLYIVTQDTEGDGLVKRVDVDDFILVDSFAPSVGGSLFTDIKFGPDENIYIVDQPNSQILRYDAETLEFMDEFVPSGSGGISNPGSIGFGPDGNLYVSDDNGILRFDGGSGNFIDVFIPLASDFQDPRGFEFTGV